MSEEAVLTEDQSHYEISLTAGQAFVAFVLLLLSLAASFAFGLVIGKGGGDDRLAVKKDAAVINEATVVTPPKKKVVELPVDDFKPVVTETTAPAPAPAQAASVEPAPSVHAAAAPPAQTSAEPPKAAAPAQAGPAYAQLLSSSDQKVAEAMAEKLIGAGFTASYVERSTTDKGMIFRVRVKFASESEARAAEGKLKEFSKDVWITK
jgi:cell division septation protein DedD